MRISDLSIGLLAYYVGKENLYALLVDEDANIERFRLAACKEVLPQINLLLTALEQPFAATASQRASIIRAFCQGWGRNLIPPGDALCRFDILLIVPHHCLHGIPLHLVECCENGPLGCVYGVVYCSSITQFERCCERNRVRKFDPNAWTFPVATDAAIASGPPVGPCLSYGVDVLTEQDAAYRELALSFASHFPDREIVMARREIKDALGNAPPRPEARTALLWPDVICLVCHGYCDTRMTDRSGLLLANRVGVMNSHNVRVHDDAELLVNDLPFAEIPLYLQPKSPPVHAGIFEPEMFSIGELKVFCETNAQLIALFGCSTGSGRVGSADDFISLANQWLKVGAASVVGNLWEADFRVIMEWAEHFARNWIELRQPKAIAAREATNGLLAARPDLVGQPLLWGSLAMQGDWL
jgi:CHAT domain